MEWFEALLKCKEDIDTALGIQYLLLPFWPKLTRRAEPEATAMSLLLGVLRT